MSQEIRVAFAGIGNCTSSLIQGLTYYRDLEDTEFVPGLMHPVLGGYRIRDIVPVAAFDIDARKVGHDLAEAIFAPPNNTYKISDVAPLGVEVMMGPVMDGHPAHLQPFVQLAEREPVNVGQVLKETGADVLVNFIPTGSAQAARYYADQAIKVAGIGFVNCIPELIASSSEYDQIGRDKGAPIIGDDVKSQVGATILHRTLAKLFLDRGLKLTKSYQLNYAGNTDFVNLAKRGESKSMTKEAAVESLIPYKFPMSSGFSFLHTQEDTKTAIIWLEGEKFGGAPIRLFVKLDVEDSPNSAGVIIDAIRCCKIARDRGIGGTLESASAYLMKHPPKQYADERAREMLEEFITGERKR